MFYKPFSAHELDQLPDDLSGRIKATIHEIMNHRGTQYTEFSLSELCGTPREDCEHCGQMRDEISEKEDQIDQLEDSLATVKSKQERLIKELETVNECCDRMYSELIEL